MRERDESRTIRSSTLLQSGCGRAAIPKGIIQKEDKRDKIRGEEGISTFQ